MIYINTLDNLQIFMEDLGQSKQLYWQVLYNLMPLIQHVRQKDIAPLLGMNPPQLSLFLAIAKGLTAPPLSELEYSSYLNEALPIVIDIEVLKEELDERLH